ncbi:MULTISPECIES: DUF1641 domain-containing protein [Fictibacillus]|jgi:uncharacterized protein YjgD (DUF1641 family)|uniref:DUF1641 domain-containing protein n=1 Tax=Fictibacillus TaxID=1329200 RepID=UPI0010290053|nr:MULTISPECIES: DUF1641 domain-containing protein [Fictibacillus]RZT23827.1 uncharacterized protein YjgD (DUF1641 family) [Fictibacillus sp. BK138]
MAQPITAVKKNVKTEEQIQQEKLAELQRALAEKDAALTKALDFIGELDKIGALEAANAMLEAKDKIASIALGQVSREPVTNMINNLMGAAGVLTKMDPEATAKLLDSVVSGLKQGEMFVESEQKIGAFDLVKSLKDPDINRAIGFGLHFLKGMGQELKK